MTPSPDHIPQIIWLDETASTNSWLRSHPEMGHATVVAARRQTAGRGQRGNSWEAEPGKNLTFSIAVKPAKIAASRQFAISRAVSIAVADTLRRLLPDADGIAIKWPNDIYVNDSKICGILIENILEGDRIARSIIGVGLNVNQLTFTSDAPNPVSMAMLASRFFDLESLLAELASAIVGLVEEEDSHEGELTGSLYASMLWRREGFHPYKSGDETFHAEIAGVSPQGMLSLRTDDRRLLTFAFKEVAPIIGNIKMPN